MFLQCLLAAERAWNITDFFSGSSGTCCLRFISERTFCFDTKIHELLSQFLPLSGYKKYLSSVLLHNKKQDFRKPTKCGFFLSSDVNHISFRFETIKNLIDSVMLNVWWKTGKTKFTIYGNFNLFFFFFSS